MSDVICETLGAEIDVMLPTLHTHIITVNIWCIYYLCYEVRDEELEELDRHRLESCHVNVAGGSENTYGKVNILLQTYVSQGRVDNFSLVSDQAYVAQVIITLTLT